MKSSHFCFVGWGGVWYAADNCFDLVMYLEASWGPIPTFLVGVVGVIWVGGEMKIRA